MEKDLTAIYHTYIIFRLFGILYFPLRSIAEWEVWTGWISMPATDFWSNSSCRRLPINGTTSMEAALKTGFV